MYLGEKTVSVQSRDLFVYDPNSKRMAVIRPDRESGQEIFLVWDNGIDWVPYYFGDIGEFSKFVDILSLTHNMRVVALDLRKEQKYSPWWVFRIV
jgi:hypothetical protein